jgi:hypothetical protein
MASTRSQLKNVFWPNIFVGASFQILDNQQAACGLKLGPAAILNQNPIFEMASSASKPHLMSDSCVASFFKMLIRQKVWRTALFHQPAPCSLT